jgi:hypothetical protein
MSKVSGEILINRLVEQVFNYVVDQRNEPIYNPRSTDELVLGGSPEGTTAAAWPPGRPPWAPQEQTIWTGLKPAGGIWLPAGHRQSGDQNRVDDLRWSDVTAAKSVSGLRNDRGQSPALGGRRWRRTADPHQEKWMKLKIELLAKAVPGGRHFCNLAGKADHQI